MAQEIIAVGTAANDGTGDPLRTAYTKCNDNFTELYDEVAALGTGAGATLDTDGTMAADSDTHVASQKAIVTYVAAQILAAVVGLWDPKGGIDCSANPNYPAASKGDTYVVTVAGKIGGVSGASVGVGDVIVAFADNAGGTQAAVGASWDTILHSAALTGALLAANNLSDLANAATARTNLGATTVGANLFTLANPSAVTFPRYNADNSVSALGAAAFRAAIGAGTGGGDLVSTNNLSDVADAPTARTNLGLHAVTTQTGTSYTALLTDADSFIRFNNAAAITFTIPPNSSVAFPIGTTIEIAQIGAGALSVAAGAGVTVNSRSSDLTLAGQYAVAFVKKVDTDTWIMNGDL